MLDGTRLVGQISRRDVMREASKLLRRGAGRKGTLLYLSALRQMHDTPPQVN